MATSRRSKKHQKKSLYKKKLEIDKDIFLKFIGKEGTLPSLVKGLKVSLLCQIGEDKAVVIVEGKNKYNVQEVYGKLIKRYNKIVRIVNNLIKHYEEDN